MAKKFVFYEVNCKIQFTKIICAEIWGISIQKFRAHANFILILEFDLEPCPLEWNQAYMYSLCLP